ncbi:MAG: fibronectin type III domain-containing protein [Planctomycetes bacterium]|nr:fibronectin type III domain-containing protein [Planctomycetota bacterium]
MSNRRRLGMARRAAARRRGVAAVERLEARLALSASAPRPFIDLGPSDNVALDQPRVTVEFGNSQGQSIGPDIFNSWLLDTGANTILVFKTGVDDMNESPPPYQVEGLFEELGVGGSQLFDISAPYRFDFAGTSGVRQTLVDARVISDATRDVSMFGPFGIVGMPAMTERVTTLDFTPWLSFGEGNFLMATDFAMEVPAATGPRYTVSVDDRVNFSPDEHVIEGDFPPVWADIPFFSAEVHHGDAVVGGNFMFDTGAQVTIISTTTALALGLDSNGDGVLDSTDVGYTRSETVGGVGGSRDAPVFMIDAVHVPTDQGVDLVWTNLLWLVADIAPGIDGVFGFDNMTSGWIDGVFSGGEPGYLRQAHLDFRGWEASGEGKIHFDINPDLDAIQTVAGPGAIVVESGGTTTVSESGYEDSYTIVLREQPAADVVVDLVAPAQALRAFPTGAEQATSLVFTPANWNVPRSVTVRAVDDTVEQSLHRSTVRHVARSADPAYDGVGMPRVLVNIVDNDYPAVLVMPTDGETRVVEGGEPDTYSLVLMRAPGQDVTINLAPADEGITAENAAGGTSLSFTAANWNVPQTVRVTAAAGSAAQGARKSYVNHQIVTADTLYAEAYVLPEIVFVDAAAPPTVDPATVSAAATAVSGSVGTAIGNAGTWGPVAPGRTIILTASAGTITQDPAGTWTWSLEPTTTLGRETVTVTATDTGLPSSTAQTTFTVTARGLPTAPTGTPGDRRVDLAWGAPPPVAGLPVTGYRIQSSSDDGKTWGDLPDTASAGTTTVVTGLTNGTPYRFRVAARDADGTGPWSEPSAAVTPVAPPAPAGALVATGGNRSVALQWQAPADSGGTPVTDYVVQYRRLSAAEWSTFADGVSTATQTTVTGLVGGANYAFRVVTRNAVGDAAPSATRAATVLGPPAAATGLRAVGGNGRADLTWNGPAVTNGSPVTDYVVQYRRASAAIWSTFADGVAPRTQATVTDLVPGANYVFRIVARSALGDATPSATAVATTAAPPGPPTWLSLFAGPGEATLTWMMPSAAGSSPVSDYVVQYRRLNSDVWSAVEDGASISRTRTVAGLVRGANYAFRIIARNAAGDGAPSAQRMITIG